VVVLLVLVVVVVVVELTMVFGGGSEGGGGSGHRGLFSSLAGRRLLSGLPLRSKVRSDLRIRSILTCSTDLLIYF